MSLSVFVISFTAALVFFYFLKRIFIHLITYQKIMNQKNISNLTPTTLSNKTAKITWPNASSMKQQFSLSDSIIYYISKNPSTPEVYLKLAQTCKYFFQKNPILIVAYVHSDLKMICSKGYLKCCYSSKCCVKVDITKLSSKIWLTDRLMLFGLDIPKFALLFLSKIYRCEEALLYLEFITITMKDFRLFATKFQKFYMHDVRIIRRDGSTIMLDKVLESISNLKEFQYEFYPYVHSANARTMKNINKLANLSNLRKIELHDIPEVFNVKDLYEFLKYHKDTKIKLDFQSNISERYKNQLDKLIDAVIACAASKHYILYYEQNQEKNKIMYNRYRS